MAMEIRELAADLTELRSADESDGMTLHGYAARFNSRSEDLGFREYIEPGAFSKSLRSRNDVKALLNHNSDVVLGSTRAGTLVLSEDERGLADTISLPDNTTGRDLAVSIKRGDISGQSFGFSVVRDEWSKDYSERRLLEVRLHEVSITAFPAYSATNVNVRALALLAKRTQLDAEALADAMTTLESGGILTDDQANVLLEAVDRSRPAREAEPEPEPSVPLSVLKDKLSLFAKGLDF
jgi:uncharacterized protein